MPRQVRRAWAGLGHRKRLPWCGICPPAPALQFPRSVPSASLRSEAGCHALEALPTVDGHSSIHRQEFVLRHKTGLKGFYPEVVINRDIILNVYTALALKLTPLPAPYKPGRQDRLPFCG